MVRNDVMRCYSFHLPASFSVDLYDPVSRRSLSMTNIDLLTFPLSQATMDSNHWVGSAIIGNSSSNSVVDQNTKVWTTNNLVALH